MLCFLISNWLPEEQRKIAHAIFELGVRLGIPFTIASSRDRIPSSAVILNYSRQSDDRNMALPCGWGSNVTLVDGQVGSVFAAKSIAGDFDYIAGNSHILDRAFEKNVKTDALDRLGRVIPSKNPLNLLDVICEPLMENAADILRSQIEKLGVNLPDRSIVPWPKQFKRAVVLTHDVDGPRLQSLRALTRYLSYGFVMGARDGRESFVYGLLTRLFGRPDPQWTFEHWRRLEASYKLRSTFFVYPGSQAAGRHRLDPAYDPQEQRLADELRKLADGGWELGVHSGLHAQGVEHHRKGRSIIESVVPQHKVLGARAHYWGRDWLNSDVSWQHLEEAGYSYDAGANPGTLGFRFGTSLPFMPTFAARGGDCDGLVVLPTAVMDSYAVARTSAMSKQELYNNITRIEASAAKHGFLMLDWHERVLSNLGVWKGFMAPLLERLNSWIDDSDVCFLTAGEAARSWQAYAKRCYVPVERFDGVQS